MDTSYHISARSQTPKSKKRVKTKVYKRNLRPKDGSYPFPPMAQCRFLRRTKYHLSKLSKTQRLLLNRFIELATQYDFIYPSQKTLAIELGLDRTTVNKALLGLESAGLVSSLHRPRKTCVYNVASIFWNLSIARKIVTLLPALLLIIQPQFTLLNNLISLVNNKSSRSRISYVVTKRRTLNSYSTRPDAFQPVKERQMSNDSDELSSRQVIEAINDVNLSMLGKSMLAIFPAIVIQAAHQQLSDFKRKGIPVHNPFALMLSSCKKACPTVDTSYNNPLLKSMKQKHNFSFQDSPLLARATNPQKVNRVSKPSGYVKKRYNPEPPPTRSTFVPIEHGERDLSIDEICTKWVSAISDPNSKHLTNLLGTRYAIKCFQNALKAHVEYHAPETTSEVDYLIQLLNGPLPKALQNQTAGGNAPIKYEDYYSVFEERLRTIDEERKHNNRDHTRPAHPTQETSTGDTSVGET